MNLKLTVTVVPGGPPNISWSGNSIDKLQLTKMKISDRLQYFGVNSEIVYKTTPWKNIKDRTKAETLIKTGLSLVKTAKYVEAVMCFNHAITITPTVVILILSMLLFDPLPPAVGRRRHGLSRQNPRGPLSGLLQALAVLRELQRLRAGHGAPARVPDRAPGQGTGAHGLLQAGVCQAGLEENQVSRGG